MILRSKIKKRWWISIDFKLRKPLNDDFVFVLHAIASEFFDLKSLIAACTASSANMEQWSFTGGNFKCEAISEFYRKSIK